MEWLIALGLVAALALLWQRRRSGGLVLSRGSDAETTGRRFPFGEAVAVLAPCGGPARIGPFHGPAGGDRQVLIRVTAACVDGEVTIRSQRSDAQWVEVRDRVSEGGGWRDEALRVGRGYVVSVPRGRHIELGCAGASGPTTECRFEVVQISQYEGPLDPVTITDPPLTAPCGQEVASGLVNLSDAMVRVKVTFLTHCTAAQPTDFAGGVIRFGKRREGLDDKPDLRVALPAADDIAGGKDINLDPGYTFSALCAGAPSRQRSCRISIQVQTPH